MPPARVATPALQRHRAACGRPRTGLMRDNPLLKLVRSEVELAPDIENLTAGAYSVGSDFAPFPVLEVAMRQTRFMSMLFLVWSIAFFFVPEFRQGLQVPFFALNPESDSGWLRHAGSIPAERLAEAARGAGQQRDAQTLAFAALHAPTVQESVRWADEAVATDITGPPSTSPNACA